jgi:hypothetical protein
MYVPVRNGTYQIALSCPGVQDSRRSEGAPGAKQGGWPQLLTTIYTAIGAVQIQTYRVPRREQEISQDCEPHCKEVCTATEQYKVV